VPRSAPPGRRQGNLRRTLPPCYSGVFSRGGGRVTLCRECAYRLGSAQRWARHKA
jgi:hypothetical protein